MTTEPGKNLTNSIPYYFKCLMDSLEFCKPNDRSEKDRAYAIVRTKLQEAYAFYYTYVENVEDKNLQE